MDPNRDAEGAIRPIVVPGGSDASHVVEEAIAEEREACVLEAEVRAQYPVAVPSLETLRNEARALVRSSQAMLDHEPADWSERKFTQGVRDAAAELAVEIQRQLDERKIRSEAPEPAPEPAARRRGRK